MRLQSVPAVSCLADPQTGSNGQTIVLIGSDKDLEQKAAYLRILSGQPSLSLQQNPEAKLSGMQNS